MSLYDDLGLDGIREKTEQVAGWSSSIKLLQSQLQLKKTAQIQQVCVAALNIMYILCTIWHKMFTIVAA